MRIAISCSGKDVNDLLDVRFGRCTYFQIFDSETEEVKCVQNKGQISNGGAGIAAAQQLVDENVNVVITGNIGPNAFNVLESSKIKLLQSGVMSIKDVIEKYKNNQLKEFANISPAHNGMGQGFRGGR